MWRIAFVLIVVSTIASATDYGPALDAAKRAALIQSGAQAEIDKAQKYAEAQGVLVLQKLGIEYEAGAAGYAYRCYRNKAITIPLGSGKKLTLRQDAVEANWSFPFPFY